MLKDVGVIDSNESETIVTFGKRPVLICFSHLRWDFVFQRPQHLLSRFAATHSVHYWEEPVFVPGLVQPHLETRLAAPNLAIVTPHLAEGLPEEVIEQGYGEPDLAPRVAVAATDAGFTSGGCGGWRIQT